MTDEFLTVVSHGVSLTFTPRKINSLNHAFTQPFYGALPNHAL